MPSLLITGITVLLGALAIVDGIRLLVRSSPSKAGEAGIPPASKAGAVVRLLFGALLIGFAFTFLQAVLILVGLAQPPR
jgi:hypothetical protein